MKKQNQSLTKHLKPYGLKVINAVGHGVNVVDGTGRCVAKVHLQDDQDVKRALRLLERRGAIHQEKL